MAKQDIEEGLIAAAAEILRPIVVRLLSSGVPFGRLEARLRELFIRVAEQELALPGRPQTDSRIALLTGINRKEVRRIRSTDGSDPAPGSFSRNQAAALISRWLSDPRTTDRAGHPRPLPYRASKGASFVNLVRDGTVDLRPGAILDELIRSGAVRRDEANLIVLQVDSYLPKRGHPEKLRMLAEDPPELVETMLRNILVDGEDLLLQRKVFYDNLGSDGIEHVRAEMRKSGERFLKQIDPLLAKHDRDRSPEAPGGERRYAGMGIYYFDGPHPPAARGRSSVRAKKASRPKKEPRR